VTNSYINKLPDVGSGEKLVVACTRHYFGADYVRDFSLPVDWSVSGHCRFTNDLSLMDQADALWFHGPSTRKLPEKKPGQKWIVMSMESDQNYPFMRSNELMDMFDIAMTYRLDSDVPCPYASWATYGRFQGAPFSAEQKPTGIAPLVYIASNPVPRRDGYVAKLMQHIQVDSLGKCLNNRSFDNFDGSTGAWGRGGFYRVAQMLKRYKFYLAFENSITDDYVTERVLMALAYGSVPVYQGAGNIDEFLPSDKCIIKANDFSSPAELADYLNYLDTNDHAYNDYLRWRTQGLRSRFREIVDVGDVDGKHRMLIKLLHGCGKNCLCGGRLRVA